MRSLTLQEGDEEDDDDYEEGGDPPAGDNEVYSDVSCVRCCVCPCVSTSSIFSRSDGPNGKMGEADLKAAYWQNKIGRLISPFAFDRVPSCIGIAWGVTSQLRPICFDTLNRATPLNRVPRYVVYLCLVTWCLRYHRP